MNTFHKTKLPNGMRVVVVPMKGNPTVTVMVLVEAGSRYESKRENGISHFLEHMCFKGTPKRPTPGAISRELDTIGAESNAFTSEEFTGYWAKARAHQFDHILEIMSDMYLNPLLPEGEIIKERGVIIEELNMYEDLPQRTVHDVLDKVMYGNQSAGRTILGPKENLLRFKRRDFVAYRTKHYTPSKSVLVIAGDVSPHSALTKAKKYFAHVPKQKRTERTATKEQQKAPQILSKHRGTDQTHFVLGFRSYNLSDPRNMAASVLAGVLGQGMSSRLFHKLREEMGVCYYVRAGDEAMTDTGVLKISAGVTTARLEEVIGEIMKELRRIRDEKVPADELAKTKELMMGRIQMGLESSDQLGMWYGGEEILKHRIETPEQTLKKIARVTAQDVQKVARDIFQNKNVNLAFIGPNKITPKLKKLLTM